jgi:long-chain acyl-CoA synthetase
MGKLVCHSIIDLSAELGEYVWKTYKESYDDSEAVAKYLLHNQLAPKIKFDDGEFRTVALYSKNREEWIITDLGCALTAITTVTLYDTLGKESLEFILDQG